MERFQTAESTLFSPASSFGELNPQHRLLRVCTNAAMMSWNAVLRGRCFPPCVAAKLTIILNAFRAGVPACTSYLTSLATSAAMNLLLTRPFFMSSTNLPRTQHLRLSRFRQVYQTSSSAFQEALEDVIQGFQHVHLEAHYRLCPYDRTPILAF